MNSGWLPDHAFSTRIALTVPDASASISFALHRLDDAVTSPLLYRWPTSTNGFASGRRDRVPPGGLDDVGREFGWRGVEPAAAGAVGGSGMDSAAPPWRPASARGDDHPPFAFSSPPVISSSAPCTRSISLSFEG
jgi:hypothetical protein